ncbi:MAG: rod-binding protein [Rhizobiaceae bacterium]|nr:rod-binding protein [Rhizobiaceae bacterium]MCV0406994.1 rod-binding protein [Rhizobiaceae bacterium]
MAISPPSDIVLDVANAVSHADLQVAREALRAKAGGAADARAFTAATDAHRPAAPAATADRADNPFVKFEAAVLQTFVQSMLPKEAESVYGEGLSGDMWKGLLAEHLAETMARRGGIGIADRLLQARYADGDKTSSLGPLSVESHARTAEDKAALSTAMTGDIQRSVMQALRPDDAAFNGVTAADAREET